MSNYFEDLVIGTVVELGSHTFTAESIRTFAEKFDPQPFHLDAVAARDSIMGGLCASGWHTAAVYTGLNIRNRQRNEAAIVANGAEIAIWGPSPGFRDLKWPRPVYVGDTVTYRQQLTAKLDMKSRPERGLAVTTGEGHNQKGELVYQVSVSIFVPRRVPLSIPATSG